MERLKQIWWLCTEKFLKDSSRSVIFQFARDKRATDLYVHLHMQRWTKFLWLTCHQFWNIFPHCNNRVCVESFARQVVNQKPCLIWDILNENFFHEAVHVDKSPEPFNALSKKGQLITVCLRATCKDRSIGWVWKIWARRSTVLAIYIDRSIKYTN